MLITLGPSLSRLAIGPRVVRSGKLLIAFMLNSLMLLDEFRIAARVFVRHVRLLWPTTRKGLLAFLRQAAAPIRTDWPNGTAARPEPFYSTANAVGENANVEMGTHI